MPVKFGRAFELIDSLPDILSVTKWCVVGWCRSESEIRPRVGKLADN